TDGGCAWNCPRITVSGPTPCCGTIWGQFSYRRAHAYRASASAGRLVSSARFGVASSDRPQVWAPFKTRRKYEVVNEILPTRSCGLATPRFAEEKIVSSG